MNVLGLYDGISCGSVALKNLGIENEYFSSEIDSHAIKIANKNFPNINQVGNIFDLNKQKLPKNRFNLRRISLYSLVYSSKK